MKKLSEEHYIICDDSEIKQGDFVYSSDGGIFKRYIDNHCQTVFPISKVTHSTQPLELICCTPEGQIKRYIDCKGCDRGTLGYNEVKPLSLSEVKELLGIVNAEMRTCQFVKSINATDEEMTAYYCGYRNALEDNKDRKYTREDLLDAFTWGFLEGTERREDVTDSVNKFSQSLQPKTEWEVEIVDGKLKLKS